MAPTYQFEHGGADRDVASLSDRSLSRRGLRIGRQALAGE
jgi:hypothetical protein